MRHRRNGSCALVATLFLSVATVPASAADRIFVNFPTASFTGDSTDPAHLNWIDAYALSGGVFAPGSPGGLPTGNATFDKVTFLKGPDRATHKLLELNQTATLSQVVIEVCRDTSPMQCYFTLTLEQVLVSEAQLMASTCLDPSTCNPSLTESIALIFPKATWSYSAFDAKGNKSGTNTGCFDLAKAVSCGFTNGIP